MNWLVIKTLKFFREKFKTLTSPKILLKTFLMVSKKRWGEFGQFSGGRTQTERPFSIYWT